MILEIRPAKDDPHKAEIYASGEKVENVSIVKAYNDGGEKSAVVSIHFNKAMLSDKAPVEKSTSKKKGE